MRGHVRRLDDALHSGTVGKDGKQVQEVGNVENRSLYAYAPLAWAIAVVVGLVVAWRLAPTRYGWIAAVVLSVFATPRLLLYQLSTLVVALREPATTKASATPEDIDR